MNQEELSHLLKIEIEKETIGIPKNESWFNKSIQFDFSSPKGSVLLWIDTFSNEVSIGLVDASLDKTTWHAHLFQLGAKGLREQVLMGTKFIGEVLSNKRPLYKSSESWQIDEDEIEKLEPRINWEKL